MRSIPEPPRIAKSDSSQKRSVLQHYPALLARQNTEEDVAKAALPSPWPCCLSASQPEKWNAWSGSQSASVLMQDPRFTVGTRQWSRTQVSHLAVSSHPRSPRRASLFKSASKCKTKRDWFSSEIARPRCASVLSKSTGCITTRLGEETMHEPSASRKRGQKQKKNNAEPQPFDIANDSEPHIDTNRHVYVLCLSACCGDRAPTVATAQVYTVLLEPQKERSVGISAKSTSRCVAMCPSTPSLWQQSTVR